jgi:putative transposase
MPHPRLRPRDHAEAVALFRAEIVGALVRRELDRGELAAALRALSQQRFRPPGSTHTRQLAVPTLERWYSAAAFVMRSGRSRRSMARR